MQNPLLITYHDIHKNDEIDSLIHEKFEKIQKENPRLIKCHVTLEKQSKHHQKANLACIRLDLKVPHFEDVVVCEKCAEDPVSLKSAVLKVFKQGIESLRENKKWRQNQKRGTGGELGEEDVEVKETI
ncbi:MAG: HPF/RaiA family ribosome-associated protein [Candidatus Omnitrophica bacterium]|nr:HPF/RaiA family ribosome-associated protein [Candidatus Omnitrophota bacterium]